MTADFPTLGTDTSLKGVGVKLVYFGTIFPLSINDRETITLTFSADTINLMTTNDSHD